MNTKNKAILAIKDFLESDKKCLLLTGTHQNEKHRLALGLLDSSVRSSTILFRVNHLRNASDFFNTRMEMKTGKSYRLNENNLYVDSINSASWKNTPWEVDYGIVYPFDSLSTNTNKEEILNDLINRVSKKIILVTWTDNQDYTWADNYIDTKVIYDVEEENPEYHERMIKIINGNISN